mmetsp:Transcript_20368/g.81439  ORF Transcript_20368/g.81439 Transcript_20368/m.81439 type:complete len:304 (-) Transcript_20368:128-1039(-)
MSSASCASSMPTTVIMPVCTGAPAASLVTAHAAAIAAPRTLRSAMAVLRSSTPANASAVYSPSEKPAVTVAFATTLGSSAASFFIAASDVRNTQTCEYRVSLSLDSGPAWMTSRRSSPSKASDAKANIDRTPGASRYGVIMPTFCAPCPGKSTAYVVGGLVAEGGAKTGTVAPTSGSGSASELVVRNLAVHQPSTAVYNPVLASAYRPMRARSEPLAFLDSSTTKTSVPASRVTSRSTVSSSQPARSIAPDLPTTVRREPSAGIGVVLGAGAAAERVVVAAGGPDAAAFVGGGGSGASEVSST